MSRKTIIPSSQSGDAALTDKTVRLCQKKLAIAEKETVTLVSQLASLGFSATDHALSRNDGRERRVKSPEPVQPFLPRSVETEVLHKNYQSLVSRLSRNESQIQTLRLNLCSIQAARELSSREQGDQQEQLAQTAEAQGAEITRLKQELDRTRKKQEAAEDDRRSAEASIKKLEAALDEAVFSKCGMEVGIEDIHLAKQKLSRRITELREELSREVSLRSSLEESNTMLVERVCEMESTMESRRIELQSVNENCLELRNEGTRLMEERKQEAAQRRDSEDALSKLRADLCAKDEKILELLEQNKNLAEALASSKRNCSDLNCEMEKQAKLVIETQTLLVQVQSERESLQDRLQLLTAEQTEEAGHQQRRDEVQQVTREKEALVKSKETLLQEVNQAIDDMNQERQALQEKAGQAQAEIAELKRRNDVLEEESSQFRERVSILDQQQAAHQRVESTLADLLESKNRLAYEKGQLTNRVEQLQRNIRSMENVQTDADKLRRAKVKIESELQETKRELVEAKQTLQHVKNSSQKEKASVKVKEEELALAVQARGEAEREAERLRKDLDAQRAREKQKTSSLQESLTNARSDQSRIAAMLESVMTSHGQLQVAVETLQTETGQKDHKLAVLQQEKLEQKRSLDKLQKEKDRLDKQLNAMEVADMNKLASLNSELAHATESQSKMAIRLKEALTMVTKLQAMTETLQSELDKKEASYQVLAETRQHEKEESGRIRQEYVAKFEAMKQQQRSATEVTHKKLYQELVELRQDYTSSRTSAEKLSKENRELQKSVEEAEQKISKLKIRLGSQKTQLDHFRNVEGRNQDLESRLAQIQDRLAEMESAKREYAAKNRDQSRTIDSFMGQVAQLQQELETLSDRQKTDVDQSRDLDLELGKVSERLTRVQRENVKLKQQLRGEEAQKQELEDKLAEASNESLEISTHLHKAHDWFKTRCQSLQTTISEMQERQAQLEQTAADQEKELQEERMKAKLQTRETQEMIKASRKALNQLANQAEIDQLETKMKMHNLARRVQAERDHATLTDHKMQTMLNASAELVEELAHEVDKTSLRKPP